MSSVSPQLFEGFRSQGMRQKHVPVLHRLRDIAYLTNGWMDIAQFTNINFGILPCVGGCVVQFATSLMFWKKTSARNRLISCRASPRFVISMKPYLTGFI